MRTSPRQAPAREIVEDLARRAEVRAKPFSVHSITRLLGPGVVEHVAVDRVWATVMRDRRHTARKQRRRLGTRHRLGQPARTEKRQGMGHGTSPTVVLIGAGLRCESIAGPGVAQCAYLSGWSAKPPVLTWRVRELLRPNFLGRNTYSSPILPIWLLAAPQHSRVDFPLGSHASPRRRHARPRSWSRCHDRIRKRTWPTLPDSRRHVHPNGHAAPAPLPIEGPEAPG